MGRIVRMSAADALAAGLIDSEIAALANVRGAAPAAAGRPGKPRRRKKAAALTTASVIDSILAHVDEAPAPPAKETKRRRSKSLPAIHPRGPLEPAGWGDLVILEDGSVNSASFHFDVVPVPKERPKIVRDPRTNGTFGFTPARTRHFHEAIKGVIRPYMKERGPIQGPVEIEMVFAIATPKTWPRWKRSAAEEGLIVPTGRPDMDNLEKALLDAFNGVLIQDDAYVVSRIARKIYAATPHIRATVRTLYVHDIHATRRAIELRRKLETSA